MEFVLTSEQIELRKALRAFLESQAPSSRLREAIDSGEGFDRSLWRRANEEFGLSAIGVDEALGGVGGGHADRAVVAEELGRSLALSPYLTSSVFAVELLRSLGEEALLSELVSGERIAAVASVARDDAARLVPGDVGVAASPRDGGWVLDGAKTHVVWGAAADVILVLASAPNGSAWFVADAESSGVTITALRTLDPTRRASRVELSGVPARRIEGDALTAQRVALGFARVALAAEQLGGYGRMLEETVAFAKLRVQFGREIGSYQAVKHSIAEMYVGLELATSVVRHAAWAADSEPEALAAAAALAQAYVGPAYAEATMVAVRMHGGIGYTWEHDAHLYYKRARGSRLLFASADTPRAELATLIGI